MSSKKLLFVTGAVFIGALTVAGACHEAPVDYCSSTCNWGGSITYAPSTASAASSSVSGGGSNTDTTSTTASASSGADYPTGPVGEGWQPFGPPECEAEIAVHPTNWPRRTWTSCGEGCRIAPASSFDGYVSANWGDGAKVVDGEIYLLTFTGKPENLLYELVRVSDGEPLAALRWKNDKCGPQGSRGTEAFIYYFKRLSNPEGLLAKYDRRLDRVDVLGPFVAGMAQEWLVWDEGWGLADLSGNLRFGVTPTGPETVTMVQGGASYAVVAKAMVAWVNNANTTTTIMRWTKELGVGALYQTPDYLARRGLAMSEDTMVWLGIRPKPDAWWAEAERVVYWAPRDPEHLTVHKGPDVTSIVAGSDYFVGKDHAAFLGQTTPNSTEADYGLVVVKLSTSEKWFITAPEGHMFVPMAVSPTEVLVQDKGPTPDRSILNYRLYSLDHLDALASPWPTPPVP